MESYQALLATLALTMGASWASGINLYAALLVLGIGGATGNIALPPDLAVLSDPMVIGAAGLMYFVNFFVDKTPGVDTAWDSLHTFIRIPAGAMLAAGAVGDVTPALEITAGILGGTLSAASHVTKAGTRALINTSPEPFSNWTASVAEDLLVLAGLWTALNHPLVFLGLLLAFILLVIWLLPKIWRALKAVVRKIRSWFGGSSPLPGHLQPEPYGGSGPLFANAMLPEGPTPGEAIYTEEQSRQIEALQVLRDAGTLSEEEYLKARRKILGE